MANAYSILHNYDTPVFTPNYQLIGTAMQYKQKKIDANRQRLQTMYDTLGVADVAKDQDKEYINNRLEAARSVVNKYAHMDLSSRNLTNQLISKFSDVVDDNVKNAVLSTRIYRSEQKEWEELKKKNPEKYAEHNHMYATQGARSWLNDGNVGSLYNGGGGVIEFTDLSSKIMDNLPELQKALKAEWVQTGPKQGYFRSLDTLEEVSRGKMQQALGFLFNEKDRQQMSINAWAQYDRAPNEVLKAEYDGYFQANLNNLDERINAVDSAIERAKTSTEKEEYRKLKSELQKERKDYSNNTFESMVNTYGRKGVYNKLYNKKFYNSILDTYSYGPRLIERKVDEVDKENKYYQLKLNADRRAEEKAQFDREMDIAKYELDVAKAKKDGVAVPGEEGESILVGPDITIDTPKARGNELDSQFEKIDAITGDMVEILKDNGLTEADISSQDLANSIQNFASTGYLKVNGKKIIVPEEDKQKVLDYYNNVVKENPAIKAANATIGDMMGNMKKLVGSLTLLSSDWDPETSMPNFNFVIKDGKVVKTSSEQHVAKDLLQQFMNPYSDGAEAKPISPDQSKTLDLYMGLWYMNDPKLDKSERRLARNYVNSILSSLPKNEAKKISTDIKNSVGTNMPNTHGTVNRVWDYWLSEISKGDMEFSENSVRYTNNPRATENAAYLLSKSPGINKLIETGKDYISTQINDQLSQMDKMAFGKEIVLTKDAKGYDNLRKRLKLPTDFKEDLYIRKNFKSTGEADVTNHVYFMKEASKAEKKEGSKDFYESDLMSVNDQTLNELGVVNVDTKRFEYDARHGDLAMSIPLGNNVYSKEKKDNWEINDIPSGDLFLDGEWANKKLVEASSKIKDIEDLRGVANMIQTYRRGDLNFEAKAENGAYQIKISDPYGNYLHSYMLRDDAGKPVTKLDSKDATDIQSDPRPYIERSFNDFINKYVEDLYLNKVSYSDNAIKDIVDPMGSINQTSTRF